MLERRPLFGLLIALTVCVSIWRISLQESSMEATEVGYSNQYQIIQNNYHHYRKYRQSQGPTQKEYMKQEKYTRRYPQQQTSQTSPSWARAPATLLPQQTFTIGGNSVDGSLQWKARRIQNGDIKIGNLKHTLPPLWTFSNSSYHNNSNNVQNHNFSSSNYNVSVVSIPPSVINYKTLPKDDLNSLIDLHDFDFIMNQIPCKNTKYSHVNGERLRLKNADSPDEASRFNPFLLILIHSAPSNFKKRLLIRETWGSMNDDTFRMIFLLGSVNSTDLQKSLELENNMFNDMVQGNFVDAYRNMTYKHVMALKWFSYYCPDVKFLLKIDDDVFVNTPFLLKYLQTDAVRQDLLFCQKQLWSYVKRSYRSKWRVSTREYPGRYYPPYCPGYSIIYSADVAYRLYVEAQNTPYFWIDDVHVTGTLSKQANISISSFLPFILKRAECKSILAGKTDIHSLSFLFSSPDIDESQARSLWSLLTRKERTNTSDHVRPILNLVLLMIFLFITF